MAEIINYWKKSKDDLIQCYTDRELEGNPIDMSRKAQIEAIKAWDAENPDKVAALQPVFVAEDSAGVGNEVTPSKMTPVKLAPDGTPLRKFKDPMMLIVFNYREDNEPPIVQLGVNGTCLNVPKDTEVLIPEYFLGVIRDSVELKDIKRTDPRTGKTVTVTSKVPRFSYTVLQTGIK